ncbi:MAG: DUF3108 domain-containing protein [Candidatus Omnitrophica bacterium]|nr:DUF3108 domain-containing protein [Candidatus Omnitrophota bacterium]MBU4589703.1 DUF3108 domain-containing protein [Candidatus Omnitrophota bacterium]
MRKTSVFLIIIFSCILAYALTNLPETGHTVEARDGETFTYEVIYNGLSIGKSTLTFNGEKQLGDKKIYHITLFTKTAALKDTEEIYGDKETFLPVEVHRTIKKKIGFADRIIEKYDQENFRVDISSKSKLRSKSFSIQKDSPIHNAILLVYYCRTKDDLKEDDKFKITLPTIDLEVMFSGIETIKTDLGEYQAYVFTSDPPKFKLWLSADEKRIPLKMKNPGTLGYSLIIKSIN